MGPLNSTGNDNRPRTWNYDPSSPNLLEWAASYHFSSSSSDILQWIAFLHACQLLCINFMALTGHLTKYRLIPTAIFGISGILHFMYTIQSQNGGRHYPIFLYLVRLPGEKKIPSSMKPSLFSKPSFSQRIIPS